MANHNVTFTAEPRVILILPRGQERPPEIVRLTANIADGTATSIRDLAHLLEDHHFRRRNPNDVGVYTALYVRNNLDTNRINALLRARGRQIFEETDPFADKHDFDPMITRSLDRIEDQIGMRRMIEGNNHNARNFQHDPDRQDQSRHSHNHADCLFVPPQMEGLTHAMERFIDRCQPRNARGRAIANTGGHVPPEAADAFVQGSDDGIPLRQKMEQVAAFARRKNIIYHEPHHDLTPGMLLLDEIFRALVAEVSALVQRINPLSPADPEPDLRELLSFVIGLEEASTPSTKFGTYICRAGDYPCPLHPEDRFHVDPSRIELFLDGGMIRVVSVKVGAWTGGTHSSGHTSP
ncbi:MAG: hypothetical protein L0Z50_30690 [Verrucomicrobiales bacterium]|nr:hypothetical protein [Verrucomicrobiales bacterium]